MVWDIVPALVQIFFGSIRSPDFFCLATTNIRASTCAIGKFQPHLYDRAVRTALVCLAMFIASSVRAGPLEGELFGYKLGTRYPVTALTKGSFSSLGHWVVIAEKPEKPKDLARVEMTTTAKTYTIGNIYGNTEFPEEGPAKALADKYTDLLSSLYADKCLPLEKYLKETLKMRCNEYELAVYHFKPDSPTGKHTVQVSLTY